MLVLGIETSTTHGGVALVSGAGLISEYTLNVEVTHSERVLPAIERMLLDAGVTLAALDGLAVSIGPGSFTGLRIGLSTAKGLAYATGLPVAAVPTLEAMAWVLPGARLPLCPVLDARKQEVYAAIFRHGPDGLVRLMEDAALAPEALAARIQTATLFLGDALETYGELFRRLLGDRFQLPPLAQRGARAACVAELGRQRLLRGERESIADLVPRYLRASEAELRRQGASPPRRGRASASPEGPGGGA
ncbi:MAG: tRNA (adenosine(37)-N6)-threonylcarbamoyltransferase complex dimerization subunit type 1 TsaB [candidate division NC10 bacterium]|nr:tRNA (adenosine(37)-N6)-threonylcarbamoyltransferase complex dimerization subunit type 1 TsaB [candidate division NC10 bacterium]